MSEPADDAEAYYRVQEEKAEAAARAGCTAKHTSYQPTVEEFNCPKCEAKCGDFCVDDGPNMECPDLHDDDNLVCYGKGGEGCKKQYYVSGKVFAAACAKKGGLVKCDCCKGTGYVQKK